MTIERPYTDTELFNAYSWSLVKSHGLIIAMASRKFPSIPEGMFNRISRLVLIYTINYNIKVY